MLDLQKSAILSELRTAIAACERRQPATESSAISTGSSALDRILPLGGIASGSLVELLGERAGSGIETVAAMLTHAALASPGAIVVVDRSRQFYPPAAAAWRLPFERLVVVHPANDAEELWAADQALRSRATVAVWLRRDRLKPHDFRRLRLSAEEGSALGLLMRPVRVRGQPTWADLQLLIEPQASIHGRRLRLEVLRCRGGAAGRSVILEIDDVTGATREIKHHEALRVSAASSLAHPAVACRATGTADSASALARAGWSAR